MTDYAHNRFEILLYGLKQMRRGRSQNQQVVQNEIVHRAFTIGAGNHVEIDELIHVQG